MLNHIVKEITKPVEIQVILDTTFSQRKEGLKAIAILTRVFFLIILLLMKAV